MVVKKALKKLQNIFFSIKLKMFKKMFFKTVNKTKVFFFKLQ